MLSRSPSVRFIFGLSVLALLLVNKDLIAKDATIEKRKDQTAYLDLEYAKVDGHSLKLDLYVPNTKRKPHLVVFFHGGSWRGGSKKTCHVHWLTKHGYAVASVDYRLTDVATFPAIIHDCKGAIRFLRANADKYGIELGNVAVSGASAGGHLAMVVATSNNVKALEGTVGGNLKHSSSVQAGLGMFCPTDLHYDATTNAARWDNKGSPIYDFLGGKPSEKLELAKQASATFHVSKDDPPIVLLAGGADKPGPTIHGKLLKAAYDKAGLDLTFQIIDGAKHGGPQYRDKVRAKLILDMLAKQLRDQ